MHISAGSIPASWVVAYSCTIPASPTTTGSCTLFIARKLLQIRRGIATPGPCNIGTIYIYMQHMGYMLNMHLIHSYALFAQYTYNAKYELNEI